MRSNPWLALTLVTLVGATACTSTSAPQSSPIGANYDCSKDSRGEVYTAGLEKPGTAGVFDFTLMSANPAPPARGDNSWIIQIDELASGAAATPVTGLDSAMMVTPYMPDHQHGSPVQAVVTAVPGQPGQYTLDPINLWMPGVWQTTISVAADGKTDSVVYSFCLPD